MPRAIALIALLACAALPSSARAAEPHVLFVAAAPTPFGARVRAEIEAMGFVLEAADALDLDHTPAAVAAARVVESPPPRRVELWVVDPARGRLSLRAVVQPSSDDDDETQTVRASEQLRAFFQPLRAPASPPAPPPAPLPARPLPPEAPSPPRTGTWASPAPPAPSSASIEPPRFMAEASIAVPVQVGGPGVDLELRARWMATRVLGVGARVDVPLAGPTITAAEGSASLSASLFGAEATAVVLDLRPLRLAARAGLAAAWLRTTGFAVSPYVGRPSDLWTALPFAGADVALRLTDRFRLCLGADAAVSLPRADVAFAGRVVASWARPLGIFSGGAGVEF